MLFKTALRGTEDTERSTQVQMVLSNEQRGLIREAKQKGDR